MKNVRFVGLDVRARPLPWRWWKRAAKCAALADINKYLAIIDERVASGKTGSQWMLDSLERLQRNASLSEAIAATTQGIYQRQQLSQPVHEWQPSKLAEAGDWKSRWSRVGQLMSTDLITARPHEPIKLVKSILRWGNVRHIPVETDDGEFLGMISTETLLQHGDSQETLPSTCAADVMDRSPPTVTPDTTIEDALKLMTARKLSSLAVLAESEVGRYCHRTRLPQDRTQYVVRFLIQGHSSATSPLLVVASNGPLHPSPAGAGLLGYHRDAIPPHFRIS